MPVSDPQDAARRLLDVIRRDGPDFDVWRRFYTGDTPLPPGVMLSDPVERMTAETARLNVTALVVDLPAQEMRVDGFRSGGETSETVWDAWQRSSMDAMQARVARAALIYGQAWTVTTAQADGTARTRTLPTRRTAGLFLDPANDAAPIIAMTVTAWPTSDTDGTASMWDDMYVYDVAIPHDARPDGSPKPPAVTGATPHNVGQQPVTRFPAMVDDDGVTSGIVQRCIDAQMALNTARFHLLDASASNASPARMITGAESEAIIGPDGSPVLDDTGQPMTRPLVVRKRDIIVSSNDSGRLQQVPGADLSGHLATVDHALRSLAMIAQATMTAVNGSQLVNLSSDALVEARRTQTRHISSIQTSLGESWERVMRLMASIDGDDDAATDWRLETVWRDVSGASIASVVDAITKLSSVGVPVQPMLSRVPEMTQTERDQITSMMTQASDEAARAQTLADNVAALSSDAASRRAERIAQATT